MEIAAVLAGPIIIACVVGGVLIFIALRVAVAVMQNLLARKKIAGLVLDHKDLTEVAMHQGDAINGMIMEFESFPATYQNVPERVKMALYDSHSEADQYLRKAVLR